jgi:hypothetical protein
MAAPRRDRRPASDSGRDADWVSASEIGTFEYCARAYWLERVHVVERTEGTGSRLAAGTVHHQAHGRRVAWQRRLVWMAVALLCAGSLLLLAREAGYRSNRASHPVPVFSL